jgi:hypothetical protein
MLKEISTEQKFDVTYVEVGENQEEFENCKGIYIKFYSSALLVPYLNEGVQYDSALIAVLLWIRIQKEKIPRKLQALIKKRFKKLSALFFSQFLVINTLDPDPDSHEMLNPDTDSINPDPQH